MELDEALRLQNEWWQTGRVSEDLAPPQRREAFIRLREAVHERQVTVLTGLRRVGKTTLFHQLIQDLLQGGTEPKKILYFSFDERLGEPKSCLDEYQRITGVEWKRERVYVFFDEIQKLPGWGAKLKLLYDLFPNLKFFVSGSSSLELEREAFSDLVGRHFRIVLEPLSLKEFFELRSGRPANFQLEREELFLLFPEYLKRPFPELVREGSERRIMEYLRENVLGKIIYQDLPKKFKGVNEDLLWSLLEIFYQNPGMILSLDSLSRNLHIAKKTLLQHLLYLQSSYLLRVVKNFRISALVASRKLQKIYPYHWSTIFGLYREIEKGKLLEAVVCSLLGARYYWRKGGQEIDFILRDGETIAVEVKRGLEPNRLPKLLKRLGLKRGLVVHEGRERERRKADGTEIEFLPVFELAFDLATVREV